MPTTVWFTTDNQAPMSRPCEPWTSPQAPGKVPGPWLYPTHSNPPGVRTDVLGPAGPVL